MPAHSQPAQFLFDSVQIDLREVETHPAMERALDEAIALYPSRWQCPDPEAALWGRRPSVELYRAARFSASAFTICALHVLVDLNMDNFLRWLRDFGFRTFLQQREISDESVWAIDA
ncbi:MAG: hypothetical protein AAGE83_07050, partial [Pseudomonadota bacterium]